MRILFIANCEVLYGANRSMFDLAIGLHDLGQDIYFFIPYQGSGENRCLLKRKVEEHGFTYAFLRFAPSVHSSGEKGITERMIRWEMNNQCLVKMKNFISKWGIDLIHTNSLTHMIGALLSRQTKKPHIWHIRETLKNDYDFCFDCRCAYKYALRSADKIICISDYVKEAHKRILKGASVPVLRDGFCTDNYILNGGYNKCQTEYHILVCGVIHEGKGQLDALKAVDCLVNKYNVGNIHLQIVGDGAGEYYEQVENYIKDNYLHAYVDILPFQEDLRRIRENTDIALMCSGGEALGRVTVESMLSGNLVIGAASGGTKEIIKDGINGYLYKRGDVDDLCKKIHYAIMHWANQERIIANAKEYAKSNFDIARYAKKILEVYKEVI